MSASLRAIGARASGPALRALLVAGAAVTGAGLLLAACASNLRAGSAGGNGAAVPAPAPKAVHRALAAGVPTAHGASGQFAASRQARTASVTLSTQSIIYTALLRFRVDNVTGVATKAAMLVTEAGGYVSGQHETIPQNKHNAAVVFLQVKIPVAAYRTTLATLRATLGKELSFMQRAQDVTQQVADVNSRVVSAETAIAQLRALLKRAGSVGQLLSVQDQINYQESNLEALLAQQRALAHETSYATVSIILYGQHAPVIKKHKKIPGFTGGLRGGWHALGTAVDWVLTAIGSALPFLIPVALIGALLYASRRRLFRRKSPPAASPPAAEAP